MIFNEVYETVANKRVARVIINNNCDVVGDDSDDIDDHDRALSMMMKRKGSSGSRSNNRTIDRAVYVEPLSLFSLFKILFFP